jgi:hypothetical protein
MQLCHIVCYLVCATELHKETSDIKIRRSCLQTRAENLSFHSDESFDEKYNCLL